MVREEYNHSRPVSALIRDWLLYSKASGGGGILKTVTGNPISVSDALAARIKSLTVEMSPIQEGSGDPSPDNVRPITGRDSVTVWRTGANVFGGDALKADVLANVSKATDASDDAVAVGVQGTGSLSFGAFKANTQYTIILDVLSGGTYLGASFEYTDGTKKTVGHGYTANTRSARAFTSDANKTIDNIVLSKGAPAYTIYCATSGIFEGVLTAADFVPYDDASVTVQLGQTVYGGTVDVTTGKATIAWKKYIGSAFANSSARTGGFYSRMLLGGETYAGGQLTPARYACNAAVKSQNQYDKWYYNAAGTVGSTVNYVHMYIPESAIDYHEGDNITALLNAAYNASDFEFVLPLAEPFDITLTPASLSTLRGDNTVWSDGDSVEMTYIADPKLYIQKVVSG